MFNFVIVRQSVKTFCKIGLACLLVSPTIFGQRTYVPSHQHFDVTSVKVHGNTPGSGLRVNQNGIEANDVTLKFLIAKAYGVRQENVTGVPKWGEVARFDVEGKVLSDELRIASLDIARPFVVDLLKERFHLDAIVEERNLPIYELVNVKTKRGMTRSLGYKWERGEISLDVDPRGEVLHCVGCTMAELADFLSKMVGRDVIDKTHLADRYSFDLEYSDPSIVGPDDTAPSIFSALQEQLGLRLNPTKSPVRVIRVNSAESPTPN